MTYVVYNGRDLLADRMIGFEYSDRDYMRLPRNEDLSVNTDGKTSMLNWKTNDAQKILFPKGGNFDGQKIKVMAMAGNTEHINEILFWLDVHDGNIMDYFKVQSCCNAKSSRRSVNRSNDYLLILEDNSAVEYGSDPIGYRCYTVEEMNKRPIHIGSGAYPVNQFLWNMKDGGNGVTALDRMVLAGALCSGVSYDFSHYDVVTEKYVPINTLSQRQRDLILAKLQNRIDLVGQQHEKRYKEIG